MKFIQFRIYQRTSNIVDFCNIQDEYTSYIHLINKRSEIIKTKNNVIRAGVILTADHNIYIISDDEDHIKSSSKFQNESYFLTHLPEQLKNIKDQQQKFQAERIQRLAHNIRSLNAKCLQSFYSVFSQEAISNTENAIMDILIQKISIEKYSIPNLLLKLHKNHLAVKTEFQVFENLYTEKPLLNKKRHKIHRVIMNVYYPFFSDFQEKNIKVNIHRSDEKAHFDYDAMHVAFFHILENAHKYTRPDSHLNIYTHVEANYSKIVFQMNSLALDDVEIDHIFNEQWSSNLAKNTGKSGNGLGMFIVKRLIEMNNGTVIFEPDISSRKLHNYNGLEIPYQQNKIIIKIPR